jgi:hypothetical protein
MRRLRRAFAPFAALIVAVGCIWIASAAAQTEPTPTDPLGVWCPQLSAPSLGQAVTCKVVADPDWTAPPSSTTTVPPTTTTPPTTTSPAHTDPAPTTTTTTTPESPPFPNAANTGVPAGTALTFLGGDDYQTQKAGEEIDARRLNALYVNHPNVVVKNSQIDTAIWVQSGSLTIERSTIGPECGGEKWLSESIRGSNYTAVAVKVRGHENGFSAGGQNITIRDSFVDICGHGEAHSDGIQDYPGGNNIVFEHNTVDLLDEVGQNAAININMGDQGSTCVSNNVRIANNLVRGGGYGLTLCPTNTGWEVTGNRVVEGTGTCPSLYDPVRNPTSSCGTYYGPWSVAHGCKGVWKDNDVVTIDESYKVTSTVENDKPC